MSESGRVNESVAALSLADVLTEARARVKALVAIVLSTAVLCAAVFLLFPAEYRAGSQLVLLSPSNERDNRGAFVPVNPFLIVGDEAAQIAASAMATVASGQVFSGDLERAGFVGAHTVEVSTSGGGVVLALTASSSSPETTMRDLTILQDQLVSYLEKRQIEAGAPPTQLYRLAFLVGDLTPQVESGDRLTFTAVVGAIGLGAALVFLVVARLRRRDDTTEAGPTDAGPTEAEAPATPAPPPLLSTAPPAPSPVMLGRPGAGGQANSATLTMPLAAVRRGSVGPTPFRPGPDAHPSAPPVPPQERQ